MMLLMMNPFLGTVLSNHSLFIQLKQKIMVGSRFNFSVKGATSWFAHLEKFSLIFFFNLSCVIRVKLLHPGSFMVFLS